MNKAHIFGELSRQFINVCRLVSVRGEGRGADWFVLATVANSPLRAVTSRWVMQNVSANSAKLSRVEI